MSDVALEYSRTLTQIAEADTVVGLRQCVMDGLSLIGVEAAYFIAPLTSDPRVGRILTCIGTNGIWERQYRARLHLIDPLPSISLTHSTAFVWPGDVEETDLTGLQQRYLKLVARYGMGQIIGVACYGPNGRSGFLGAVWTDEQPPIAGHKQWVNSVGQGSFRRYCQLIRNDDEIVPLSNRELQVTSWMCEGKSNSVIAQILEISRSSVDMYVRRIFAKLGVSDRTAACLRAYSLGLIVTGDYQRLMVEARQREQSDRVR